MIMTKYFNLTMKRINHHTRDHVYIHTLNLIYSQSNGVGVNKRSDWCRYYMNIWIFNNLIFSILDSYHRLFQIGL